MGATGRSNSRPWISPRPLCDLMISYRSARDLSFFVRYSPISFTWSTIFRFSNNSSTLKGRSRHKGIPPVGGSMISWRHGCSRPFLLPEMLPPARRFLMPSQPSSHPALRRISARQNMVPVRPIPHWISSRISSMSCSSQSALTPFKNSSVAG